MNRFSDMNMTMANDKSGFAENMAGKVSNNGVFLSLYLGREGNLLCRNRGGCCIRSGESNNKNNTRYVLSHVDVSWITVYKIVRNVLQFYLYKIKQIQ